MVATLILVGCAFLICLIATPFLLVLWLVNKWSKWVQRMTCGGSSDADNAKLLKLLSKLIK